MKLKLNDKKFRISQYIYSEGNIVDEDNVRYNNVQLCNLLNNYISESNGLKRSLNNYYSNSIRIINGESPLPKNKSLDYYQGIVDFYNYLKDYKRELF